MDTRQLNHLFTKNKVKTKLYNKEQKEQYILDRENDNSNVNIRRTMQVFFAASANSELELLKDCSNFSVREICDMFAEQKSSSTKFLENFKSQMSIYTDWCIDNNLVKDNTNHYKEISKDVMTGFLNRDDSRIITRDKVLKIINTFPNVSDSFMVLAIFEGFKRSDFYQLTLENFHSCTVLDKVELGDRSLIVSPKLIELAIESANEYRKFDYEGETRGYKRTDTRIVKASSNAMTNTLERSNKNIQERLAKLKKEYGKAFGYKNLQNSGRIDLITDLMNSEFIYDIEYIYDTYKTEIENRYGKLYTDYPEWIEDNKKFILD